MKKKIKIYENEIKRATRRKLMENYLDEQHEMRDTYSRADYKSSPRERGVKGVFGKYGEEIPPAVLRYMRKNPAAIVKRLHKLYGDRIFDSVKGSGDEFMAIDTKTGKYGPYDRDNDGIASSVDQDDDGDGMLDLNIDVMGEATTETVTQTKMSKSEWDDLMNKGGGVTGTVTQNPEDKSITVTTESTKDLFKKFLNTRK